MSKIPKDTRLYTAILQLPTDKQPTDIAGWIQAVTLARQEGRKLLRDSEAWRTTKPSTDHGKGDKNKRDHEDHNPSGKKHKKEKPSYPNPRGPRDPNAPVCNSCGNVAVLKEGIMHSPATCWIGNETHARRIHPEINPDPSVPFLQSHFGKLWAASPHGPTVNSRMLLNGAPFEPKKNKDAQKPYSAGGKCKLVNSLSDNTDE
jgi:hypothetical protein